MAKSIQTYKQEVKEKSRRGIWTHAVKSLTENRDENRIFNKDYMKKLLAYVEEHSQSEVDPSKVMSFDSYADLVYGKKEPSELKVAFFCGPEPENDVEILLSLGVRLENMFAFECEKANFQQAVGALHGKYPQLKIFNGRIETYATLHQTFFDIVYLDFCASLTKCYNAVCEVLDSNMLTPLSVFAVNSTIPEKTEENILFLANYFFYDVMFEHTVKPEDGADNDELPRVESCMVYGIDDVDTFIPIIEANFEATYSAFQTDFINTYANITKPMYEVMSRPILRNRLFKPD